MARVGGRNSNLGGKDLYTKRQEIAGRDHQIKPRFYDGGTPRKVQNPRTDHMKLLVATNSVGHQEIH